MISRGCSTWIYLVSHNLQELIAHMISCWPAMRSFFPSMFFNRLLTPLIVQSPFWGILSRQVDSRRCPPSCCSFITWFYSLVVMVSRHQPVQLWQVFGFHRQSASCEVCYDCSGPGLLALRVTLEAPAMCQNQHPHITVAKAWGPRAQGEAWNWGTG